MAHLLVMDVGRALFVGPLGALTPHHAAADALLLGLDGPFDVQLDGAWRSCEVTLVPSLTRHALDFHGRPMACLYLEPGVAEPTRRDVDVATLRAAVRAVSSDPSPEGWGALWATVGLAPRSTASDTRLMQVAARLVGAPDEAVPATELAASVGLSVSRLEHLFTAHFGVPLRAYRTWHRLRLVAAHALEGASLTEAAHAAGFFDSAHFSRTFRQTFGFAPSTVLGATLRGRVL